MSDSHSADGQLAPARQAGLQVARACSRAGRNLSGEEWAAYIGGEYRSACDEWLAGS